MDRHMWQDHLILCSRFFVEHARHYTARLHSSSTDPSSINTSSSCSSSNTTTPLPLSAPMDVLPIRETAICGDDSEEDDSDLEDDPGGGGGGPAAGLRTSYPHPGAPHPAHHLHHHLNNNVHPYVVLPHPHLQQKHSTTGPINSNDAHRPMSLHEVSMLKAELQLVTGDRGEVIRGGSTDNRHATSKMLRDNSNNYSLSGGSLGGGVGLDPRVMMRGSNPLGPPPLQQPLMTQQPIGQEAVTRPLLLTATSAPGGGAAVGDLKRALPSSGSSSNSSNSGVGLTATTTTTRSTVVEERVFLTGNEGLLTPQSSSSASSATAMAISPPPVNMGMPPGSSHESHSGREYERLKAKCEWAEKELQSLKRQHGETVKKCDQAVREADLYRHKYKLTKDRIDMMENEMQAVKTDHRSLLSEKQRFVQEVDELKKLHEQDQLEIEKLENQQREAMSESGSSEMLNTMYDSALDKYRNMKQEYDELRKRYNELGASHNANQSKLESLQEDNRRTQKQYEDMRVELETANIERKGLQTQCTAAIRKWHNVIHEKTELEKDMQKARHERDEYKKGHKQAVADNIRSNKDVGRLRVERDAVMQEYQLVMSERDAVHNEIEQLNNKLAKSQKKCDDLEKERKSLALEVEKLRQDVGSALHDRDHALKLLTDSRQQSSEQVSTDGNLSERELTGRGSHDPLERDRMQQASYEQLQQQKKDAQAESQELVNKEVESLRREVEKLQADLSDALSEAELSKRRRDWAFSERDKIVLERESIKTLCDELRRERDRAVSEQAQALRDLDDLRKQKMEACKTLKDVKEKYDAMLEKEARKAQLHTAVGHNHSRDSAIDADLQEWETETLELDIGTVGVDDLGFDLCGGKDDPQLPNDSSIFISNIAKTGMAHGKLKVNDQLIRVNNIDVTNTEKKVVMQAVKSGGSIINMVVRRRKSSTTRPIQPVHLHLTGSRELGISIESGLYISRILPGSVAAKEGNLAVGDRILNVNGQSVENLSVCDVHHLVEEGGDYVVLSVLKYAPTPQPSLVSSSASSGQILPDTSSPEATSSSPKSPRAHQLWVTPSPDATKTLHIKSSGSQTDSLDSPQGGAGRDISQPPPLPAHPPPSQPPGGLDLLDLDPPVGLKMHQNDRDVVSSSSGNSSNQPVMYDPACAKIFMDGYSTADRRMTPSSSRREHHHHHHRHRNAERSHTTPLKTHMLQGIIPPVSSSAGPPPSSVEDRAVDDEVNDVVEELNTIIKHEQDKLHGGHHPKSPGSRSRRDKELENGGTWPKCRQNFDYPPNGPGAFPSTRDSGKKERPPLFVSDHPYLSGSSTSSSQGAPPSHLPPPVPSGSSSSKVPPTPPERSDSFNRGKSIKHSPQNSDSLVKYGHDQRHVVSASALPPSSGGGSSSIMGAPPNSSSSNSKSSPYIPSTSASSTVISAFTSGNKQPCSLGHLVSSPSSIPPQQQLRATTGSQPMDQKSLTLALTSERDPLKQHRDRLPEHVQKTTAAMLLDSGMPFAGGSAGLPVSSTPGGPLLPTSLQQPLPVASTSSSCSSPVSCSSPSVGAVSYLPMDTSVKSAKPNSQELADYIRRPRPSRPTSAPSSRSRKERRELAAAAAHKGPGTIPVQKPTSLPVQSMYSPRPLPSSHGQNIGPTQPLLFRHGSPTTVKPTNSSGSIGQRSIDGCYPFILGRPSTGTSAGGTAVVWPLAQSHRASPSGGFTMTSPTSSIPSSYSSQPLSPRYTPPNSYATSRSGNDILSDSENERSGPLYGVLDNRLNTPSPSPSQQSSSFNQSSQTLSDEYPVYPRSAMLPWSSHGSEGQCSTLPRHHRHYPPDRFPARTTPSLEKGSDRESPIPNYSFQPNQSHSLPANMRHKRPQVGETRNIHVEKSQGPLGIQIDPNSSSGIFVSSVSENSLAAHAGIEVGDQLLEVCGINMRKAPYKLAASVLRQCRDSVTMLVQYNPEKYMEEESSDEDSSSDSSANNTPQAARTTRGGSDGSTITPQSLSPQSLSPSHSSKPSDGNYMPCEPRFVFLTKSSPQDPLGIHFIGGNASGIFVDSISPQSIASGPQGLRCGDQILEFNGTNLRAATAEQADHEVSKPTDSRVTILAQYNIAKYNALRDKPGDAIYVRALCDYEAEIEGELSFKKDDILFVDNTLYNGMPGVWRAWLVDDEGNKLRSGTIPSKTRLEDELAHKRSLSDTIHDDELKGARRGSASARRSFFRRKKHTRNNSKDSRELNSFSDASINSDSIPYLDDGHTMPFQRVERLDCMIHRPVLILGPLAEPLIEKLTSESPDKYCRCKPERVRATQSSIETGKDKGVFLDYQRRDSHYECIRVDTIKEIIDKNRHAMLDCSPEAIERLHKVQIYPIVLFVRHKSPKQIREVKDTRFLPEKLSNKVAKELHEQYQEYETKYKMHFSECIPGGNLAYMSVNIKGSIDKHQRKTLWIPAGSI